MINPSAHGWIDKFFSEQKFSEAIPVETPDSFYYKVRETGFIYGHIIAIDSQVPIPIKGWFKTEISKVALLNTLYHVFCLEKRNSEPKNFISEVLKFYKEMSPEGFNLFKILLPKDTPSLSLENIIDERVQTNDSIISKNFSHLVTNALLFIDVLAFRKYLEHGEIPEKYLKRIEETVLGIVGLALKTKTVKSQHDDLLIKLFEASIRYSKFSKVTVETLETLQLDYFQNKLEQYYLIDMAGMALWSDGVVENEESYFLYSLGSTMGVSDDFVTKSIDTTNNFITTHKHKIPYFNYSNPVKHFYDQMTHSVMKLIVRNKNRLIKEIVQSKELMVLLALSTTRDLDPKEKKKVKKQLLDICKTIPSLTIFLLPGGSLLLPILIKFIPTMLPSAFNENLDENE
ncbi:LETM1-related biofilm-associated protein [Flavobacterium foetidum]|uniref:LETM1-related biofilm-associated protein n=1 Tax=Flavobacterium foetidum TaxID=2026681 RepID=UPI001074A92C|nr:LETM1-related biofilm-associated protein [Flavobacterium foetidum]KAF2517078.1 hypothetical protein E0W73_02990 [Flavobacterium foetidum]